MHQLCGLITAIAAIALAGGCDLAQVQRVDGMFEDGDPLYDTGEAPDEDAGSTAGSSSGGSGSSRGSGSSTSSGGTTSGGTSSGGKPTNCSDSGGKATQIIVYNKTKDRTLQLLWVKPDCVEAPYGYIGHGAYRKQKTFFKHAWRVRDQKTKEVLLDFVVEEGKTLSFYYPPQ